MFTPTPNLSDHDIGLLVFVIAPAVALLCWLYNAKKLGKFKKLAYRYCGPFEILRRMGEQAYELELPPHLHVHNVFHVSLLKKYIAGPQHVLNEDDTILISQEEFQMELEQILEVKERKLRHKTMREVLVQWKGYPIEDASSEDWDRLVAQFSHLK